MNNRAFVKRCVKYSVSDLQKWHLPSDLPIKLSLYSVKISLCIIFHCICFSLLLMGVSKDPFQCVVQLMSVLKSIFHLSTYLG